MRDDQGMVVLRMRKREDEEDNREGMAYSLTFGIWV